MPVIRCQRCGSTQYVAATHATLPHCGGCGRWIAVTRETLTDPVIAAGAARRPRPRRRVHPAA